MSNVFTFRPAAREQTPLLLGLVGPSGSGKTMSALRLAQGIQSVCGGKIAAIDTEARRMLHYAERFKFDYLEFSAPFGSDRYLEAAEAAVAMGAKTVIFDSMSHEHEGPGGHLEFHDEEVKRLVNAGGFKTDFAAQIPAWTKPSARRRKMINGLLQFKANFIFCFRAKEKIKLVKRNGKTEPVELGWQAIAGEEFVYEMADRFLLTPGCKGVPDFSDDGWATGVPKLPDDHSNLVPKGMQLNEEIGANLARWAQGAAPVTSERAERIESMTADLELVAREQGLAELQAAWGRLTKEDRTAIGEAGLTRLKKLAKKPDSPQEEQAA